MTWTYVLSKFVLEGKETIWRDLDSLEKWAHRNLIVLNKSKCNILNPSQGNPWKYRLDDRWIECSAAEKDLELLVDKKTEDELEIQSCNPEN